MAGGCEGIVFTVDEIATIPLFSALAQNELEYLAGTVEDIHLLPGEYAAASQFELPSLLVTASYGWSVGKPGGRRPQWRCGSMIKARDWAPCAVCDGQLELWTNGDGSESDGDWVHVTGDGQYVYIDHRPEPNGHRR